MQDRRERVLPQIEERYINSYGIYRWKLKDNNQITAISANNWTDFNNFLNTITSVDRLIVSPELITCTELETENVVDSKKLIEERIDKVKTISTQYPEATIILGTAVFGGEEKSKNGVLFIKNGEVIGQSAKRSGVTAWEKENFTFDPEEKANLIPGTKLGVLICSDLPMASLYSESFEFLDIVLKKTGHGNLVGHNPNFIHQEAKALLVPSCWGIGGNEWLMEKNELIDEYYKSGLKIATLRVLTNVPQVQEVVVVDRVPDVDKNYKGKITTKPINAFFSRK
jgi:hypothetical protein